MAKMLTWWKLPLFILSSLLKMGLTSAKLNGVGNVSIAIQSFIRLEVDTGNSLYAILISLPPEILSYPVAFKNDILNTLHHQIHSNRTKFEVTLNRFELLSNFMYSGMIFVLMYGITSRKYFIIKSNVGSNIGGNWVGGFNVKSTHKQIARHRNHNQNKQALVSAGNTFPGRENVLRVMEMPNAFYHIVSLLPFSSIFQPCVVSFTDSEYMYNHWIYHLGK